MLNQEQEKVVNSINKKILVEASAGTGKTTVLTEAARKDIEKGLKPVLITFTNQAAEEMRCKLKLENSDIFIGTIHKYSINLIYELAEQYHFRVNFLKREQIQAIIRKLLVKSDLELNQYEFNQCLSYITSKKSFLEQNDKVPEYFIEIEQDYSRFKNRINAFDFTDSPQYLSRMLNKYEYTKVLDGLYIDEAQDLTTEEYEIITKLHTKKVFAIGDTRQSIYLFRDADANVFSKMLQDGYSFYTLNINYRSKQEIIDFAKGYQIAARGKGGIVYSSLLDLFKTKPMILCRTNAIVNELSKYYKNVMTIHKAKGCQYPTVLICDFEESNIEEENIMYVAKTRAENGVGLFSFQEVLKFLQLYKF